MIPLTFIMAFDKTSTVLRDSLEMALEESKISHHLLYEAENIVATGNIPERWPIPRNAILYVHGNYAKHYLNVGMVRGLAEQRKDLKFIIAVDVQYSTREYFSTESDYRFVQTLLEQEFHAKHSFNVTPYDPSSFISGRDYQRDLEEIHNSLPRYLQQWKELQEALRL